MAVGSLNGFLGLFVTIALFRLYMTQSTHRATEEAIAPLNKAAEEDQKRYDRIQDEDTSSVDEATPKRPSDVKDDQDKS